MGTRFMSKFLQILAVIRDVTKQDTYVTKQDTILDLNHLNLGVRLKMVPYSAVDIRTHHQRPADHSIIYSIIYFIAKMSCLVTSHLMKIKFKKQNEVSH